MTGQGRIGSFECYQSDMPDRMEQGYAAAAGESGPMSIALAGEDSWACYQTDTMKWYRAAADIVAAESSRMSA